MKKILMQYMTKYSTLNEEQQQAIVEEIQIEKCGKRHDDKSCSSN